MAFSELLWGRFFRVLIFPLLGAARLIPQLGRAPEDAACNPGSASAYPIAHTTLLL